MYSFLFHWSALKCSVHWYKVVCKCIFEQYSMWGKFWPKKIKGKIKNKKVTAVRGIKKAVFSKKYFKKVQNHASQPPKIAVDLLIFFYLYPIRRSHPFKILCWVVTPWIVLNFVSYAVSFVTHWNHHLSTLRSPIQTIQRWTSWWINWTVWITQ